MAQHTKHPATAPPTAPERESTGHLLMRGYAILVLVAVFAHSALYNLTGIVGAGIAIVALTLGTLGMLIPMIARARPHRFPWRRLPWAVMGYAAFALLSLAWSQWRVPTMLTWTLLIGITVNALFIAYALSWHEIVHSLSAAFKWILGLSLALELWVSLVLRGPLLPNFMTLPSGDIDPHWYWVRDNLLDGGRIQGIVGNSNLLAFLCLFAMIVFGVRIAMRVRWQSTHVLWMLLAAYFFIRAASATAYLSAAGVAITLIVALLIRRTDSYRRRARIYVTSAVIAGVGGAVLLFLRGPLFELLGRTADLTGRTDLVWSKVLERASASPVVGVGFSSPWIPTDPAFDGWIVDHGITVFHAHNMWLDVLMQLGVVGVVLMSAAYGSLLWRAWFFAADRPRWDLRTDRDYSPLTLVPVLFTVALLVQGLAESTPIMLWGWMLLTLLSFKIKAVPLVGVGLSAQAHVIERGNASRRVP